METQTTSSFGDAPKTSHYDNLIRAPYTKTTRKQMISPNLIDSIGVSWRRKNAFVSLVGLSLMRFGFSRDAIHQSKENAAQDEGHMDGHLPQQHFRIAFSWVIRDFHKRFQKIDSGDSNNRADDF